MNDDVKAKPKCRDDALVIVLEPNVGLPQCVTSSDDEYVEAVEEFIVEVQPKKKKQKKAKAKVEAADPLPAVVENVIPQIVAEAEKEAVFLDAVEEVVEEKLTEVEVKSKLVEQAEKDVMSEQENQPPSEGFEKPKERKRKNRGNKAAAAAAATVEPVKAVPKAKQKPQPKVESATGDVFKDTVEPGTDWALIAGDIADNSTVTTYENPVAEQPNNRSRNNSQARSSRNRSRNRSTHRGGHGQQSFSNNGNANKAQKTRSGHSIAPPPKPNSNDVRLDRKFCPMTGANAIPVAQHVFTHANPPVIKQKTPPPTQTAPSSAPNQQNQPKAASPANQNDSKPLPNQPKLAPWAPQRAPSPAPVKKANIFGEAKPVDTAKKLKEIEAKRFAHSGSSDDSSKSNGHNNSRQSLGGQFKSASMIIYRTGIEPDQCNQDVSSAAFHENLGPNNQFPDAAAVVVSRPPPPSSAASTSSHRSSQSNRNSRHQKHGKHDVSTNVGTTTAPIPKAGNEGTGSGPRKPTNLSHQSSSAPRDADATNMQEVVKAAPPKANGSTSGVVLNEKQSQQQQQNRQRRATVPSTTSAVEYNNRQPPPPPPGTQYYPQPMQMPPIDGQGPPPQFVFVGPPPQQQGIRFAGPPQQQRNGNPNMAPPRQQLINCHQLYMPGPGGPPPQQNQPNVDGPPGGAPRPMQNGTYPPQPNGVAYYSPPNGTNGQPGYPQGQVMQNPQMAQYMPGPGVAPMMAYPPPQPGQPQPRPVYVDYQNGNFQQPFVCVVQPNGVRMQLPVNYAVVPTQAAVLSQSYSSQTSASGTSNTQYTAVPPPGMMFTPSNYVYPPPAPLQPVHQMNDPSMYYGPPSVQQPSALPPNSDSAPAPESVPEKAVAKKSEVTTEEIKERLLKATNFNPDVPAFVPSSQRAPAVEQEPQQNGTLNESGDSAIGTAEHSETPTNLPERPDSPPPPMPQPTYTQVLQQPLPQAQQIPPQQYHQPPPPMPHQYQQHPQFQHPMQYQPSHISPQPRQPPPMQQQQSLPQQPLPQYYQPNGYGPPMPPPQYYPNNGYMPQHQLPPPPNGQQYAYAPRPNGPWGQVPYGAPIQAPDGSKQYQRPAYGANYDPRQQQQQQQRQNRQPVKHKQRRDGPKTSVTSTVSTVPSPPDSVPDVDVLKTPKVNSDQPNGVPVAALEKNGVSADVSENADLVPEQQPEFNVEFTAKLPEPAEAREPTPEVTLTLPLKPTATMPPNQPRTNSKKQRRSGNRRKH